MRDKIANIVAILWFFGILIWALLFGVFALIMIPCYDIAGMISSGYTKSTEGLFFCFVLGVIFSLTGLIPVFRKAYYKLPWLYPFTVMLIMNLFIVSIAETIIAKGFAIDSAFHHVMAITVMSIQIIACRIAMSKYLQKYPLLIHKYDRLE